MTATANSRSYDLAMIGFGGAAFAAAIRATNLGRRVVMIERGTVGGREQGLGGHAPGGVSTCLCKRGGHR